MIMCNWLIAQFLQLCEEVGMPINMSKTEWATQIIVFLGILLNGITYPILIPEDKWNKVLDMLLSLHQCSKAQVKQLQTLCGYLNFLCKAIYPGRTFLRCMYSKYACASMALNKSGNNAVSPHLVHKPYHHVKLDQEFWLDCQVWLEFLSDRSKHVVCRPMINILESVSAEQVRFSSDTTANSKLGFGCILVITGPGDSGSQAT